MKCINVTYNKYILSGGSYSQPTIQRLCLFFSLHKLFAVWNKSTKQNKNPICSIKYSRNYFFLGNGRMLYIFLFQIF